MEAERSKPQLEVTGLCKRYPSFSLKDVSFSVMPGTIVGFIGRNGAGKTTTLKCLMGSVHPDSGMLRAFGQPFDGNEAAIKQITGFALGGALYYATKTLATITAVTKRFYELWDDASYLHYLNLFGLDERKRIKDLSQGMRVKYALALALSHGSKLLVLDEPTSGLDPASRDEVLDTFLDLVADGRTSILFSTHITSDLDKCADSIVHIRNGAIIDAAPLREYREKYRVVPFDSAVASGMLILGKRRTASGDTALVSAGECPDGHRADLEEIMTHMDKGV